MFDLPFQVTGSVDHEQPCAHFGRRAMRFGAVCYLVAHAGLQNENPAIVQFGAQLSL